MQVQGITMFSKLACLFQAYSSLLLLLDSSIIWWTEMNDAALLLHSGSHNLTLSFLHVSVGVW